MKAKDFKEKIIAPLETWSHLGEATNEMGTRLIGHVPHIAPKAYLHIVYAPTDSEEFAELDQRLGRPAPGQLREFFAFANGLRIFSGSISVDGFVPHKRKAESHPHNNPANIVIPNSQGRIRGLSPKSVVVGFYKYDGSYASVEEDGRVVRFDAKKPGTAIQEWPDFDSWLFSEIAYLQRHFDKGGKMTADPSDVFAPH